MTIKHHQCQIRTGVARPEQAVRGNPAVDARWAVRGRNLDGRCTPSAPGLGFRLLLGQAPPVHIDLLCEPEYKQVYADIESWLTERI